MQPNAETEYFVVAVALPAVAALHEKRSFEVKLELLHQKKTFAPWRGHLQTTIISGDGRFKVGWTHRRIIDTRTPKAATGQHVAALMPLAPLICQGVTNVVV